MAPLYMRRGSTRTSLAILAIALAIACWLYGGLARAADTHVPDSPFCLSDADATAKANAWLELHDGAILKVIEGDKASAWIDTFNATPPTSDYRADKIWVPLDPGDMGVATIAFFVDGQTCHSAHMPAGMFLSIARAARGT